MSNAAEVRCGEVEAQLASANEKLTKPEQLRAELQVQTEERVLYPRTWDEYTVNNSCLFWSCKHSLETFLAHLYI